MTKSILSLSVSLLAALTGSVTAQPIEDNSFLIEEAYNQEKGVIQYINTFTRTSTGNWAYSFTNEMPIKVRKHQFSYTINVARVDGSAAFGDIALNYRYQFAGLNEDDRVSAAPRFSLIIPTGNYREETGAGAVGFQFNMPVSVTHSDRVVTHWNAGTTVIPRSRGRSGDRADSVGFNLGQSTVFLAKKKFNMLFETSWNSYQKVDGPGRTETEYSLLLNPGIRWAWNLKNGFQVVPGIAVPFGVGPSWGDRGVFLYLSFEK